MNSTRPDTELDLSGFLAAHRAMRVEFGRLAAVAAEPRDEWHARLIDDQIAVHLDLLHQHHSHEDSELWPKLRERAPAAAPELDMLEAQHGDIEPLIDIAGDATLARRRRAATLSALHTAINRHLDDEERIALPLILEHITPDEWAALGRRAIDTMSPKQRRLALGASALDASPEELAHLMAALPAPVRLMLRLRWIHAWRRRNQRLYGDPASEG